jgi:hypothetical protein
MCGHPGGWFVTELGGDQDEALARDLCTAGFAAVTPWCDDDGDPRAVATGLGPP